MERAKQLIVILCITMVLMISNGIGEERQVYQLAEDCPVFSMPGDMENSQILPKGKNVEIVLKTVYGGEDWSLVLSSDGIYGYVRSDYLLTDETSMKADLHSQGTEESKSLQIGNIVTFGRYEQDNNTANGPEQIEWIVLDVQEGKSLLLSRYALDVQPYNTEFVNTTWQTSTLRKWLNDGFVNKAFTAQERIGILTTNVDNNKGQGYSKWSTSGGPNTDDKVFLLSYAETHKYLGVTDGNIENIKSRVAPTFYAIQNGANTSISYKTEDDRRAGWWWLRSPGIGQDYGAFVGSGGYLCYYYVHISFGCIRPALWIDLGSAVFKVVETENQILPSTVKAEHEEKTGNIVIYLNNAGSAYGEFLGCAYTSAQ